MRNSNKDKIIIVRAALLAAVVMFCYSAEAADFLPPVKATPEIIKQATSLKQREDAVMAREAEVAARTKELQRLEKDIDAKLARLEALQDEVQKKLQYIESLKVRDKEFKKLIKVYSAMSATKLAPLLDEMGDENVAKILRAMQTDATAKIIPKLDKDKAVRVSKLLGMM